MSGHVAFGWHLGQVPFRCSRDPLESVHQFSSDGAAAADTRPVAGPDAVAHTRVLERDETT